jgi:hypothetical protein
MSAPPLNPFVLTLFRKQADAGWVSIYYSNSSSYETALATAQTLNTNEMKISGQATECVRVAVSQLGVSRDVIASLPTTTTGSFVGVPASSADFNACWTITFFANPLIRAKKFLRGLPASLVNQTPEASFTPDATYKTAFDAYATFVIANCVLVHGPRTGPGPFNTAPIFQLPVFQAGATIPLSIRRAGRPFAAPRGRARVGA